MTLICHITNTDVYHDNRIIKELMSFDDIHSTDVCVVGVGGGIYKINIGIDALNIKNISLANYGNFYSRPIRYFFELLEFTCRAVHACNKLSRDGEHRNLIVHCHDTFALPAGYILKFLLGAKLVYDAHELESDKNGQNKILSWATLLIEKICWPKVDLLVSVSDSIIEWYHKKFSYKPSALVLNSPVVNLTIQNPENAFCDDYFRHQFNIPQDHSVFIYLGILGAGRGIEICLEAFSKTQSKVAIVFVGFGLLEADIVAAAQKSAKIHFHPAVAHDQVVNLVKHADYGVCLIENVSLSDYLCLPNKLFEYAFAGLSILGSDFPEISKVVKQYELGEVCEPNLPQLLQKLSEIDGRRPMKITTNLYELSWDAQANRLRAAYAALMAA